MSLLQIIHEDFRRKALWCYEATDRRSMFKAFCSDGGTAMVLYRLMQWCGHRRLRLLEMILNKLNAVMCNCIIGRGAEFGPGLVLIHSTGVVINGSVRGGSGIHIEHQVTIGADQRISPTIGDEVFIGAGAKIIGNVKVGNGARIGANAVVIEDVPQGRTAVGVPARLVSQPEVVRLAA
jgi:serine O-acetyltransferase